MEKQETIKILTKLLMELGIKIDKNTGKTPERIVKAWTEMCRGIGKDKEIKEALSIEFPSNYTGMVTQGPLDIFSLCSHHLLPVEYKVYVGYIPSNKKVLGFSKISKAIALIAAKPQNQEDFTQEIAVRFIESLDPEGLGVVVIGKHHCMHSRSNGINHFNSVNITSSFKRSFRKFQATKDEFYKNIQMINLDKNSL